MNNIAAWNAAGHKRPEIERAADLFKAGLLASLGHAPTAVEAGLVDTASTLYLAVLLCERKLRSGRDRKGDLMDQLPILSGSLNRILRSLSRGKAADNPNGPPPGATFEEKRAWSKAYVERRLAEVREQP